MVEPHVLQWHVTWSTQGRRPIAPDEARRRALLRAVVDRTGAVLVLFSIVDDHLHVWLIGGRPALVAAVRSIGYALRALAAAPVQAPHVEPVERRGHAEWLVAYLLTQTTHHGIATHPAAWSGAALPDLLGARRIGRGARSEALVVAAGAAFAAGPDLTGRDAENVLAIGVAARLGRHAPGGPPPRVPRQPGGLRGGAAAHGVEGAPRPTPGRGAVAGGGALHGTGVTLPPRSLPIPPRTSRPPNSPPPVTTQTRPGSAPGAGHPGRAPLEPPSRPTPPPPPRIPTLRSRRHPSPRSCRGSWR